jgi:hypothetical protein
MTRAVIVVLMALAAAAAPVNADDRDDAEQFYRIGERAYKKQNYKVAAKNFDEAYARAKLPDVAFAAAQAHRLQYYVDRKRERLERAIELYRIYVAEVKEGGRVGDASQSLAELEPILRELTGTTSPSTAPIATELERPTSLAISVEPADAKDLTVTVDGKPSSALDTVTVDVGDHEVRAEAKGYLPAVKKVRAIANETRPVELVLAPMNAVVQVTGDRGADVSVDGKLVGRLPRAIELPAGDHVIGVTRRGRRAWTKEVALARGDKLTLEVDLESTRQRRVSKWMMGGAGALVIASGVCGVIATVAGHDAREIDDRRKTGGITLAEQERYVELKAKRDDYRATALVLGGVALAAGAAAALLYYFDTPEVAAPVTPIVTSEGAGVAITGAF